MTSTMQSIAILSGKGGVGKTSISLNLSYLLHQLGHNVLVADCDMGLANMDVMLGTTPAVSVVDVLADAPPIEQVRTPLLLSPLEPGRKQYRLDLLPGNCGDNRTTVLDAETCDAFCCYINDAAKEYDFLVLDTGAGISPMVLNFAAQSTLRLLIATPEPTSLTDCYAFLKVLHANKALDTFYILINQAESTEEALNAYERLAATCENFLGFRPIYLHEVAFDDQISKSIIAQEPLVTFAPRSPASYDLQRVASLLTTLTFPMQGKDNRDSYIYQI